MLFEKLNSLRQLHSLLDLIWFRNILFGVNLIIDVDLIACIQDHVAPATDKADRTHPKQGFFNPGRI